MIISNVENIDCIEGMKQFPDNYFDLAICDPPYGINADNSKKNNLVMTKHQSKNWDINIPSDEYFQELFRVSKNQIIWGGNYFHLEPTRCWLIWNKLNPMKGKFSDFEMAWTSLKTPSQIYEQAWIGFGRKFIEKDEPIHPTQKPLHLYEWIIQNYAKQGNKILDTHLGSQSSRIAAYKKGFDFWGFEIDKDYFEQGNERFEKSIAMPLFDAPKELSCSQLTFA